MTELTQAQIYDLIDAEHTKFLKAITAIRWRDDVCESVRDSIDDMLTQDVDDLSELKITAERADEAADRELSKWDIEANRYDDMRMEAACG